MSELKLKPCPFCGGEAKAILHKPDVATIECFTCGLIIEGYTPRLPYIWNNRMSDKIEKENAKLKKEIKRLKMTVAVYEHELKEVRG